MWKLRKELYLHQSVKYERQGTFIIRKSEIIQCRYVEISYIGLYPNRKKSAEGTGKICISLLLRQ